MKYLVTIKYAGTKTGLMLIDKRALTEIQDGMRSTPYEIEKVIKSAR